MSNRLPFAALAIACVVAAGAGGYLATRQNAIPAPASAQTGAALPAPAAPGHEAVPAAGTGAVAASPARLETETVLPDGTSKSGGTAISKSSERRAEPSARSTQPHPGYASRDARAAATMAHPGAGATASVPAPRMSPQQGPTPMAGNPTVPPSAAQLPAAQAPPVPTQDPFGRPDDRIAQEPVRPVEPMKPTFEDLVIPRDSVIGLRTDNRISSETAKVEDRVDARVTRDVKVGDRVAIPAGARVIGSVTQVERGGKFKEQARLGIRFHTIVLADGTQVPLSTETIMRLGEAPGNGTAAKIGGGAVGGAILGAILGGAKGAAIGATAGAGAGTAAVTAGDRSAVVLQPGTQLTPRILSPVTVTVER